LSLEAKTLKQTITEEAAVVQQFVDQLKLEQTALSAGDTDNLSTFADQKSMLAVRLGDLAERRNALVAAQGFSPDRKGIEAWCEKHPAELAAAGTWAKILKLASEARELNILNGKLIQLRMNFTAKALEALQAGKNSLDLYGPDGQSTKTGHRRIDHAV